MPEVQARRRQIVLPAARSGFCPSLDFTGPAPLVRGTVKLEPLSRRRPCRRPGPACRSRSHCAVRSSISAGPLDAVIDIRRSRRLSGGGGLALLLSALGLARSLFRRGLRLGLSLLRHAALLAMSEWRCRNSAHGDRKHYTPITTAERKKHLFHLKKRVCRLGDPSCCGPALIRDDICAFCDAIMRRLSRSFQ
jgi:hypothetical protein